MTRTFDLVVRGGTLVTPRTTFAADVAVVSERIAAIGAPGSFDGVAAHMLDAHGRYVLPGLIDAHVHFREPGLDYKEDFGTGSRAAVMGGVTTVLEMPNTLPPTSTAALVLEKQELAEAKSYCDFGLYGLLVQDSVEQLEAMAKAGVIGFKCFLGQSTGNIGPPDDGRLLEALGIIARLGLRCAFHAESEQIMQHHIAALKARGRTDALAHVDSRPVVAEVEAIQRAALLASEARASIHILHLSSGPGLATIEEWRRKGVDITCETTPQHCFLTAEQMADLGSMLRINPPVREAGHGAVLLEALASGRIDLMATDHSPHVQSEKVHEDIWQAVSGFVGVETSLRLFLTYAVHTGKMTLQQLARVSSEGPARTWGLYPSKGTLQVGADADLTLVDLSVEDVIEEHRLHSKNNPTPFQGHRTRGAAVVTVVRGQVLMRDGELVGRPMGRMLRPRLTRTAADT